MTHCASFALFLSLMAGCTPAATAPDKPSPRLPAQAVSSAPSAGPTPGEEGSSSVLPEDVDLEITVTPDSSPQPLTRVRIRARGEGLSAWQSVKTLDFLETPVARDSVGELPLTVGSGPTGTKITFSKAPSGPVSLTYAVRGAQADFMDPPPVLVDPDRFAASGEAMIAIPAAFEDKVVRATLRVGLDAIGVGELAGAATSFGVGPKVSAEARGADLRQSFFLAGYLGHGQFHAPEGNDNVAWLGFTTFDPRPGFADMAGFRTAMRQLFGSADADRCTFLFVSDKRPAGDFVVTRRPRSVVAWVSERDAWTAPLRIAVATAVVHGWIGGRLWVGPSDPAREAEAYWFTEGIARHLAADMLFRFGLVSPTELAQEVEGLASVLATSPRGADSNEALRKDPKGALPVLVARGALYGLSVDAKLRAKKTGDKRSLQNVVRELYKQAAEVKGPLAAQAWVDLLVQDLGAPARAAFTSTIEEGKPVDLPDDAMGPCFRKVTRSYTTFDLSFDEKATRKSEKVTGLEKGGPADRAGLREGDEVARIAIAGRTADSTVEVTVTRGGKETKIAYRPTGKSGKGPGFERKKDVPDDACSP